MEEIELENRTIYALKKRSAVIRIENTFEGLIMKNYNLVDYLLVDNHVWFLHDIIFVNFLLLLAHFL